MKSTVYAKNVNVSASCTCDQLVLMREGINKMITVIRIDLVQILEQSASGF